MSETVLSNIDEEKGIATLTLNRPDKHNAFDDRIIERLNGCWQELSQRPDIRVVILKAEGKSFSAGADLKWMARAAEFSDEENIEDARKLARMLYHFYHLPQFTISRVQGRALGGGLGLVACSDIALADRHCVFSLPEVRLGLTPATIAPYLLQAIGARAARRYFQSGEHFTAQRALDLGLIHETGEDIEELDSLIEGLVETVSKNSVNAMRQAKKLVKDLKGTPIEEDVINDTSNRLAIIRSSDEARQRLQTFLDKSSKKE